MSAGLENPLHLLLVLAVVLLLFGAKRMPEMGRSLGKGIREFKGGILGHDAVEVSGSSDSSQTEVAEQTAKDNDP